MRAIDRAIAKGLAYLSSAQTPEGTFVTQFSLQRDEFVVEEEAQTTFAPALILQALAGVEGANEIRQRVVHWLLKQQSHTGAFNYWPVDSVLRQTRPYPDDLDDTACALAGIYLHNSELIDSAQLAKLVQLLIASESTVGGPYNTWLVDTTSWRDIDLAVNSNVAFLLQLVAEPLPKLQDLLDQAVTQEDFRSSYYPDSQIVMYFIARACQSDQTRKRLIYLLQRSEKVLERSPGKVALRLTSLRNLGVTTPLHDLVDFLLHSQQADGSWAAENLWMDRKKVDKMYAGSPALTTAFVLEALNRSLPIAQKKPIHSTVDPQLQSAFTKARSRLSHLPSPLFVDAGNMLESLTLGNNAHEVALLPYLFVDSLKGSSRVPETVLQDLSLASIFGWIAYGAYDDFLDDANGPQRLPVANAVMRLSLHHFMAAAPNRQFEQLVRNIFDRIDAANAWEVAHCRFVYDDTTITVGELPKYPSATFLAERSIGHALTPLAILANLGKTTSHTAVQSFLRGFRHYLAARQLNDDLHDWQDDLLAGRISYVVARLLRESGTTGRHSKAVLIPKLERQLWYDSLPQLCSETQRQLQKSRENYASSGLFRGGSALVQLVLRLEQAIEDTLKEQKRARDFLDYYTNKNSR